MSLEQQVFGCAGAGDSVTRAVALRLAQAGARIALIGDATLRPDLQAQGATVAAFPGDPADPAQAAAMLAAAAAQWSRLDGILLSLPAAPRRALADLTAGDWQETARRTLRLAYGLVRAAAGHLEAGGGRVLVLTPRTLFGSGGNAADTATGAALLGFVRSLALEVGRSGVTANVVAYQAIDTPEGRDQDAGLAERLPKVTALRRGGSAADVAGAVHFLAGAAGGFITGQVLTVCGGSSIAQVIY